MENSLQKTSRELAIAKGRTITILIVGYLIFAEIFLAILKSLSNQAISVVDLIRFAITVGLSILLYQGRLWARSFLAFGTGIGVLTGGYALYTVITTPGTTLFALFVTLAITIFSGMSVYNLTFSTDVDQFIRSKKS